MSLINQMLKDLEQRGANDASKITPAALDVGASQGNTFPFVKVALLLILAGAGYYSWQLSANKAATGPEVSIKQPNAAETNASKAAATTTLAANNPATAEPNAAAAATPVSNTVSGNIQTTPPAPAKAAPPTTTESQITPLFARTLQYTAAEYLAPAKNLSRDKTASKPTQESKLEDTLNKLTVGTSEPAPVSVSNSANNKPAPKLSKELGRDYATSGKQIRPEQKSSNHYRQALANLQQGRVSEAEDNLKQALEDNPANMEARQTLASLLLDNKRNDEAKAVLSAGLASNPEQTDFRMALARLQVDAGDRSGALATLEQGLPYAKNNADYQSFTATMLQRAERHDEAISHYSAALSLNPSNTNALIGLGISAQAVGKLDTAKEAFTRAQTSTTLSAEMSAFVEQRLKQINQKLARS